MPAAPCSATTPGPAAQTFPASLPSWHVTAAPIQRSHPASDPPAPAARLPRSPAAGLSQPIPPVHSIALLWPWTPRPSDPDHRRGRDTPHTPFHLGGPLWGHLGWIFSFHTRSRPLGSSPRAAPLTHALPAHGPATHATPTRCTLGTPHTARQNTRPSRPRTIGPALWLRPGPALTTLHGPALTTLHAARAKHYWP